MSRGAASGFADPSGPDIWGPEAAEPWRPASNGTMANALTCDVEDYFHVSAFEHLIPRSSWDEMEWRIAENVDRVLELFSEARVSGTFFTLGWVAERLPEVVRRIATNGHEVASHGMRHERVWKQGRDQFREDVIRSKQLLEDLTGQQVHGYRAASWSLDSRTPWAHAILREAGYTYSSSIYPIAHDHFGVPAAPTTPFFVPSVGLLEVPASTVRIAGRNWPAAGGGYFRLYPLAASLWLLRRVVKPAVFYFHPWELDVDQPRVPEICLETRFRHYLNLGKFERRLKALLTAFKWDRMDRIFCPDREGGR